MKETKKLKYTKKIIKKTKLIILLSLFLVSITLVTALDITTTRHTIQECEKYKVLQEFYGVKCDECSMRTTIEGIQLYSTTCDLIGEGCSNFCINGETTCSGKQVSECVLYQNGCYQWKKQGLFLGECGVECIDDVDCGEGMKCGWVAGNFNKCESIAESPYVFKSFTNIEECEQFKNSQLSSGQECTDCSRTGGSVYTHSVTCAKKFGVSQCDLGNTKCEENIFYNCENQPFWKIYNYWKPLGKTAGECEIECSNSNDCGEGFLCVKENCIEQELIEKQKQECKYNSDCLTKTHIACSGQWSCDVGECNWNCHNEEEQEREQKSTKQNVFKSIIESIWSFLNSIFKF